MDINPAIRELELGQIRRFVAIVECGTFVAAADRLGMTQQALSTSIAKMEQLAGVCFLERKRGGRITLTVFGRLLLTRAKSLLALSDRTMSELGLLRTAHSGSVTLGIGETMTGRGVAIAIRRYHEQHPDVQIRLIESYTETMIDRLLEGQIDFVIGSPSRDPATAPFLEYRHLFEVRDALAVRAEHPLAHRGKLTLAALSSFTWLIPGKRSDVYDAINISYMRASLPPPKRVLLSDAVVVGMWLCLEADYITVAPPDMLGPIMGGGAMTMLDVDELSMVRHACVVTRRDVTLSPAANRLMEEIIVEVERDQRQTRPRGKQPLRTKTF